ncbi:MAG TPA: malto-oligosyltrehalose trehalohydrolase [Polyangia bacterium]|nr:malto-oligosyltrehalose trehalohydrolase [Polyangia bacterium]
MSEAQPPLLGATVEDGRLHVGLYTTTAARCQVRLYQADGTPGALHPMTRAAGEGSAGFWRVEIPGAGYGTRYKLVLDGQELPDPYARFLPEGVDGAALVVDPAYGWRHRPVSRPLAEHVVYELHVGTFSPEGTYAGVAKRLPELAELGVTAVELMPLAAFAGARGWGYDGVALFAPHAPYGTPADLKALVDQAHGLGLAVFLDVVYNHFGPAGNYLTSYSPDYFTSEIKNAWGDSPNYAHPLMRRLVLDNALYWLREFHFDGLRLDAIHAITDPSPRHLLRELVDRVSELDPRPLLIAEDERNDPDAVRKLGLDALWADDFHHVVRVSLTGERDGYLACYQPGAAEIARVIERGWLFEGQTFPLTGKPRGKPATDLDAAAFVYCIQNHDQVGNRAMGDRLNAAISLEQYRAASMLLLFLPATPLLFMGQEWAATTPFQYFTNHEEGLGKLISEGRRQEFRHFKAFADPALRDAIPDPQAAQTFERSRLNWDERRTDPHAGVLALYRELLRLRRSDPVLRDATRRGLQARAVGEVLIVERRSGAEKRTLLVNFGRSAAPFGELGPRSGTEEVIFRSDGPSGEPAPPDLLPPATAVILAARAGTGRT